MKFYRKESFMKKIFIFSLALNIFLIFIMYGMHKNYKDFQHRVIDNLPVKYLDKIKVGEF